MRDYCEELEKFSLLSKKIRTTILNMVYETQGPHIGSSYSMVDLLVVLYFKTLSVSPIRPFKPNRDRFILSKGHACPALYAVLAERGFITEEELKQFAINGGLFEQHPSIDLKRGIELSTGSLGHGLSVGVGMALSAKNDGKSYRVFVMLGDGEQNEGTVWEAAMFAAHHGLDNLVVIIDYNKIQALGHTNEILNLEPLSKKWEAFGWETKEIDGHDFSQIDSAFSAIPFSTGKPSAIIAHTIKGKGVSFMEDELLWHYRSPNNEEYEKALEEILQ